MIKKNNNLASFLYEIGTLRKVVRAHRQMLLEDDLSDNIASHSYRTAIIGWHLAKMENADPYKVVMMCLMHDLAEVRSGDHNWVHKKHVSIDEEKIVKNQLVSLLYGKELFELIGEFNKRKTKEAKIAKDADHVDQILLLKEYAWKGNKEAERWVKDKAKEKNRKYYSRSARDLIKNIVKQDPTDWWQTLLWKPTDLY